MFASSVCFIKYTLIIIIKYVKQINKKKSKKRKKKRLFLSAQYGGGNEKMDIYLRFVTHFRNLSSFTSSAIVPPQAVITAKLAQA
jgi:ATP-dependent phosphoenolpyruvate carboxykinase